MKVNQPVNQIDYYKSDHRSQYPHGTEKVVSNLTARKSRMPEVKEIVFFGLQYFIKEYLIRQWNEDFFQQPKEKVVARYKRRIETSLGKDAITFEHIEALHDLGYLPVKIKALPEGSTIPMRCACLVIFNTRPEFFWLTNYFETILSCTVWGACTSATIAHQYRKMLDSFADKTVGDRSFVQWQGHDFSFRGMFGLEAACMSGAAHLLSFTGTDTIPAIDFLEEYYGADADKELIGASVAATEHSVMSLGTEYKTEDGGSVSTNDMPVFKRLITETYPKGIVSVVSDTFDFWRVITEYVPQLKDVILARDGKVVIRPDSGDPVKIVSGYKIYDYDKDNWLYEPSAVGEAILKDGKLYLIHSSGGNEVRNYCYCNEKNELAPAEVKGAVECLWETFGGTITEKGYKLLDSHIGLIYGDSITIERGTAILQRLMDKGFCSFNVVLGIGSFTYQYVTRDTFGFAVKATYGEVNGEARNIFKTPKTDDGTKNSAKGLIAIYRSEGDGKYEMRDQSTWDQVNNCELQTVFEDGKLYNEQTLAQIRERIRN